MRAGEVIRCPTVEYLLEREIVQRDVADRQSGGELCFRARDMTTGSRVRLALWPAAPAAVIARVRARAQLLASLDAKGVERLLQHGVTIADGAVPAVPFVATEWVQGESLEERLPRGGLGYDDAIRLGAAIARVLDQAHAKGLVHGEIGPATVVLPASADGLGDRGVPDAVTLVGFVSAATGAVSGGSEGPLDPRVDLHALGAILYRIVSGRPPSDHPDPTGTTPMEARRSVPLASLAPLAPDALCKLVDACLSPDPSARPASGKDVLARLEALRSRAAGASDPPRSKPAPATMIARQSAAPPSRPRPSGPVTERSNVSIAIIATAFGVLGVAGVVALVAIRSAKSTSAPGLSGEPPLGSGTSSAAPDPTAPPTSSAPILSTVPIPRPSAPAARFSCGMSFYCSAETQYCLVATDRETNFSCVKAPKCPGRPECDCVTVEYDSCERIGGGLMVRRSSGKKPPPDDEEEE